MNYSTAVMLINENIKAIKVIYEPEMDVKNPKNTRYMFKTLDPSIKAGDYVTIPTDTRHGMTVALVVEVDSEVDFENSLVIKWVIDKVNTLDNENILKDEQEWIEALKASEKRKKREEIKKNMLEMYENDGIENLSIAKIGSDSAIEDKKSK